MAVAVVCREHGLPDKLDLSHDWPVPELGPNDVRLNVKAAGLNFPDVLIIQGKYQFQPELPFVPGGECAGVVEAVGSEVTRWKVGDEVVQMGMAGGFCDTLVVNENSLLPKPSTLSMTEAAGIGI
ncbi:MAG: alcohol dehydrogenase catalytic domain-containing protein, partial [Luminiphilus sp.]